MGKFGMASPRREKSPLVSQKMQQDLSEIARDRCAIHFTLCQKKIFPWQLERSKGWNHGYGEMNGVILILCELYSLWQSRSTCLISSVWEPPASHTKRGILVTGVFNSKGMGRHYLPVHSWDIQALILCNGACQKQAYLQALGLGAQSPGLRRTNWWTRQVDGFFKNHLGRDGCILLSGSNVRVWYVSLTKKESHLSPKQGCGIQSSMLYRNIIGVAASGLSKEGWRRLQWDVSDWHCVWFTFWVKELQPPCEVVSCGTTLARIHFIICFLWAFWVLVFLFWLWIYLLIFKIKKNYFGGCTGS